MNDTLSAFHDGPKGHTLDFMCLEATFGWNSRTSFDGHSDTIRILYYNSWNTRGGFLKRTLSCSLKFSTHFEVDWLFGRVARGARLKNVLKMRRVITKLSLLRRNASTADERYCTLHQCMMNEFSDLAQVIAVNWIPIKLPSLATNWLIFNSNISKIKWMASISNMVIWSHPLCTLFSFPY